MSFIATVPVIFPYNCKIVYRALCDLERYPLWVLGMQSISSRGPMRKGLRYSTEVLVTGAVNRAQIEVVRMVPNEEIETRSTASHVSYQMVMRLRALSEHETEVTADLRFEFSNLMMDLARPAVEAMAEARLRADLETLRGLLLQKNGAA